MQFDLTDEQRLLGESLGRFIAERYSFEDRLAAMREPDGFSAALWQELAALGVLGLPFAEEDGGFGGGGVETMVVMEALGKGLVVEPYFATAILGGGALRLAGSAAQKAERIEKIIAGAHRMALAHHEPGGLRHSHDRLNTRAARTKDGWRLDGEKIAVIAGDSADELVISAMSDEGVALFLVDAGSGGVRRSTRTGYDGVRVADVALDGVILPTEALLGQPGQGGSVLSALFEEANAALAAEAVGIMAEVLDMTVDYLKTRVQFGVPIASFQALQHRAVDMLMQVELARSMAMLAALSLRSDARSRALNIAAAKAKIGQAGRFVGQQAVQLHGAIGLTMEYKVGHAFKRLTAIDALFGDADHQLDVIAAAGGLPAIGLGETPGAGDLSDAESAALMALAADIRPGENVRADPRLAEHAPRGAGELSAEESAAILNFATDVRPGENFHPED
jgi:alkylation response protein AidB-like acyl-CoA dehydrogenase